MVDGFAPRTLEHAELSARFRHVEGVGKPVRVRSNFVKGYAHLPVRVHPH